MTPPPAFELQRTYVHLADDGGALPVDVSESF